MGEKYLRSCSAFIDGGKTFTQYLDGVVPVCSHSMPLSQLNKGLHHINSIIAKRSYG